MSLNTKFQFTQSKAIFPVAVQKGLDGMAGEPKRKHISMELFDQIPSRFLLCPHAFGSKGISHRGTAHVFFFVQNWLDLNLL